MSSLLNVNYYSLVSVLGFAWSILAYWLMFTGRGKSILSNPWFILVAATAMAPSIWYVAVEAIRLRELAGGIPALDTQYGYGPTDIFEFGSALGEAGRQEYAAFQLGADTLAPPAFVCFLMAVYRSTVSSTLLQRVLTMIAFCYFTSVLIANTFMPVIMIHFPDTDSGILPLLYIVIPNMDLVKYSSHGLAWLLILTAWIWQFGQWCLKRASPPQPQS